MAYDETLVERIRRALAGRSGVVEKRMMGGLTFMVDGHMCCGVVRDELMVRVGPEQNDDALARPHARPMDFTGRPMRGFVFVGADGIRTDEELEAWIASGARFVGSLPPK